MRKAWTMTLAALAALTFMTLATGCDDKDARAGEAPAAAAAEEALKTPSADEVKAIDCDKACATQMSCYDKGGMVKVTDEMKKTCLTGCNTLRDFYKPDMHGRTAATFINYADGKCK